MSDHEIEALLATGNPDELRTLCHELRRQNNELRQGIGVLGQVSLAAQLEAQRQHNEDLERINELLEECAALERKLTEAYRDQTSTRQTLAQLSEWNRERYMGASADTTKGKGA